VEQLCSIEDIVKILEVIDEYYILAKIESSSSDSLKRIAKWKILHNYGKILSVIALLCIRKPLCVVVK
jgi:N-acetylglutamate synthase-like GNAT family acetyltransferase